MTAQTSTGDSNGPGDGPQHYQATYRRSELVIPGLLVILVLFAIALTGAIRYRDDWNFETSVFAVLGLTLLALALLVNAGFRTHRWMIGFSDIAALRRVESGLDRQIEMATRDGRRHRLSQLYLPAGRGLALPRPAVADVDDFAGAIRAAATRAGYRLPEMAEGLSFWNAMPGLVLLSALLAISLALSAGLIWAFIDGLTLEPRARGGEAAAILLLLPVGAAYLLRKCWRRRRAVLAALASAPVDRSL